MKQIFCFVKFINISILIFSMSIWSIPAYAYSSEQSYYNSELSTGYGYGAMPARKACTEEKILADTLEVVVDDGKKKRKDIERNIKKVKKDLLKYLNRDAVEDMEKEKLNPKHFNFALCEQGNRDSHEKILGKLDINKKAIKENEKKIEMDENKIAANEKQRKTDKEEIVSLMEEDVNAVASFEDEKPYLETCKTLTKKKSTLLVKDEKSMVLVCEAEEKRKVALRDKISGLKVSNQTLTRIHERLTEKNKISIEKKNELIGKDTTLRDEEAKLLGIMRKGPEALVLDFAFSAELCKIKNAPTPNYCHANKAAAAYDKKYKGDEKKSKPAPSGSVKHCGENKGCYYSKTASKSSTPKKATNSGGCSENTQAIVDIFSEGIPKDICSYKNLWNTEKNSKEPTKLNVQACSKLVASLDNHHEKLSDLEEKLDTYEAADDIGSLKEAVEAGCKDCASAAGSGGRQQGVIFYGPAGRPQVQKKETSPWLKIGAGILGAWGLGTVFSKLGDKSAKYATDSNEALGYETDAEALSRQSAALGLQGASMGYRIVNSAFTSKTNKSSSAAGPGYFYRGYYRQGGHGLLHGSASYSGSYGCAQSIGGFQIQEGGNFWSNNGPGSNIYGAPIVEGVFGYPRHLYGPQGGAPFYAGIDPYGQLIRGGAGQSGVILNDGSRGPTPPGVFLNSSHHGLINGPRWSNGGPNQLPWINGSINRLYNNGVRGSNGVYDDRLLGPNQLPWINGSINRLYNNGLQRTNGLHNNRSQWIDGSVNVNNANNRANLARQYQIQIAEQYRQNASAWIQQQQSINRQKQDRSQQISEVQQQIHQLNLQMQQIATAPYDTNYNTNGRISYDGGVRSNSWSSRRSSGYIDEGGVRIDLDIGARTNRGECGTYASKFVKCNSDSRNKNNRGDYDSGNGSGNKSSHRIGAESEGR